MQSTREKHRLPFVTALIETFGFSPWFASIVALFLLCLLAAAAVWLWLSAPPRTITVLTGPPGTSFDRYAHFVEGANPDNPTYEKELAGWGIQTRVLPSGGSLDNLRRLQAGEADIGFVQGGLVGDKVPEGLVSLGSVAYQPIWVFYRDTTKINRLAELAGKRVGVGAKGSGTNVLALALLQMNGITGAPTVFVEQAAEDAANDLLENKLDAVFLMGEAASVQTLRNLLRADGVDLFHFTQADAYVRRVPGGYLNKIILPQGSLDFAKNLPAQDVALIGPAVELIARKDLNSAVSDLVLAAAGHVHGRSGLLARRGEFPAPLEREFPISEDAKRYYKSGLGFTYRLVPNLYLASLINRILVAIVPIMLVLIPAVRLLPIAYKWSVQLRIYRCYRPLLRLEREAKGHLTDPEAQELLARLDEIEDDVNKLKVPASFAYQFYALRGHVAFVRSRLNEALAA